MSNMLADLWDKTWFRMLSFLLVFPVYSMGVIGVNNFLSPVASTITMSFPPIVAAFLILDRGEE